MFDVKDIRIKEMILNALLRWRLIIIAALIMAVVLPGVMYINSQRKSDKKSSNSDNQDKSVPIATQINDTCDLAELYQQEIRLEKRIKQSMQLGDDNGVVKYAIIQYNIEPEKDKNGKYLIESDTIGGMYSTFVKDGDSVDALIKVLNAEIDPAVYTKNMLLFTENSNLTLKIPIVGDIDEEKFLDVIDKMISEKTAQTQEGMKHSLRLINKGVAEEVNANIVNERNSLDAEKTKLNKSISTYTSGLSEEQIELAKKMAEGEISENDVKEQIEKENDADTARGLGTKKLILYAIVGGFAGAFITMIALCEIYMMSDHLHSSRELTGRAKVTLLGTLEISASKNKTKLDEIIRYHLHANKRKLDIDQQIEEITTAISLWLRQNHKSDICLISSMVGMHQSDIISKLIDRLQEKDVKSKYMGSIVYDKNSLLACTESDGAVLVEQLGKSTLPEIENEMLTAQAYDICILGTIVLE